MLHRLKRVKLFIICFILTLSITTLNINFISYDEPDNAVIIYHTNDMHGKVNSEYNSRNELSQIGLDIIKDIKKQEPNSLLVDAGDATQGDIFASQSNGANIIRLMNEVGYDAMAIGNHEFDYGIEAFMLNAGLAKFPIISANTFLDNSPLTNGINKGNGCNIIKEVNGKKIGFFGITTQETAYKTNPKNVLGVGFRDVVETSREQVEELNSQGADLVVGVMHLGSDASSTTTSYDVARLVDGIDIIIDGHSHTVDSTRYKKENGEETVIAQTGCNSKNIGRVSVEFLDGEPEINSNVISAAELGRHFVADTDISQQYNEYAECLNVTKERVIGRVEGTLYGGVYNGKSISRLSETNLGDLVSDALIWAGKEATQGTKYEGYPIVSLQNGGSIRTSIQSGYINVSSINQTLPFQNSMSIKLVNPSVVYQTLENGVCKLQPPQNKGEELKGAYGGFAQVGGMRFEVDLSQCAYNPDNPSEGTGNRVKKVVLLNKDGTDGQILNREDTSTPIVFISDDFKTAGGDGYNMLKDLPHILEGGTIDKIFSDYIEKLTFEGGGAFKCPAVQNRITLIGEDKLYDKFDSLIKLTKDNLTLPQKEVLVSIDDNDGVIMRTDENGNISLKNLDFGDHIVSVEYNGVKNDCYLNNSIGIKDGAINLDDNLDVEVKDVINIIRQIEGGTKQKDVKFIKFARDSYNSLNKQQKEKVVNYDALVEKENSIINDKILSSSVFGFLSFSNITL